MLTLTNKPLCNILKSEFKPFPKWGEPGWQKIPQSVRSALLERAEKAKDQKWEILPATLYMDYKRNGNRSRYEDLVNDRIERVLSLMLAECIEGKGRFIDSLINGVWAICEESTWVAPAHNIYHYASEDEAEALAPLDHKLSYIDLSDGEMGSLLSWIYYFLKDRLAQESPLIPQRIEAEIQRRILDPFLNYNHMEWMALSHDRPVNNWNPWINSNVLIAFLLVEKDPDRRVQGAEKVLHSLERFLRFYAEDGGCDEGPNYFSSAGACFLDILEILYEATDGQFNIFDDPMVGNIADYIRHMHIDGQYYINFADSPCTIPNVSAGLLIRIGELTHRPQLANFGKLLYKNGDAFIPLGNAMQNGRLDHCKLYRSLKALFTYADIDFSSVEEEAAENYYYPGIQVAIMHGKDKLVAAAKGDHNAESHNHNDIGNYILYSKGHPCVVDAGVGQYSKKTFGPHRYEIWSMQSGYHNTAIVNGQHQMNGRAFAAHSASFEDLGDRVCFSLNMEKAYEPQAGLASYRREMVMDRTAGTFEVCDCVQLHKIEEPLRLPIMCDQAPVLEDGLAHLGGMTLHYDPQLFSAEYEAVPLDDEENPITCWNKEFLYRLILTRRDQVLSDSWKLRYTVDEN